MPCAIVKKAYNNDIYCGDECACWEDGNRIVLFIADGLGHGREAEIAAREALKYVSSHLHEKPEDIFAGCNAAIRETRGVAMGLALIDKEKRNLTYAGIGNTRALIVGEKISRLSGNYGIVGASYRKLIPEILPLPCGYRVIMYTDGIEEMIEPERYIHENADLKFLSEKIMEDWSKDSDDAAVLVFRVLYDRDNTASGGKMIIITEEMKDVLTELMNTGVGRAAAALSELLHTEIFLSVPFLEILNPEEMRSSLLSDIENEFVNIKQDFCGGLAGKGIVSFPVSKGKTLINILLDSFNEAEENLNVLELEAISEVGNLVINAIGSTIADMIGQEIECRLPSVSIANHMIDMDEEKPGSVYVVGQTDFAVKDRLIEGKILFVFSYENIESLVESFL